MNKLPIGQRIRFVKTITDDANEERPESVFAYENELGQITGRITVSDSYWVKTDNWPHAFLAKPGFDFAIVHELEQFQNAVIRAAAASASMPSAIVAPDPTPKPKRPFFRWPRGKYNGQRIVGVSLKIKIDVLEWQWFPKLPRFTNCLVWGPFFIWLQWEYEF